MAQKSYSVTEYAKKQKQTRQAILWQCNNNKLPDGATAKKIGATWIISQDETE